MQSRFGRLMGLFFGVLLLASYTEAFADCSWSTANSILAENACPGNPKSEWDISGVGSTSIQGFATDISVNQGGTVQFKIQTNRAYKIDIYRMGYYGGNGARKVATVPPPGTSSTFPANTQRACASDLSTGLIDCGNWTVTASWAVPANATSGIYFAKITRTDGRASHLFFVVRNDSSRSDILFKTSDTTWQAYNNYGGVNLYTGGPGLQGGAYKVSYNRPFYTRAYEFWSWVFNAEYPMVRFLEANGYDVSYFTGVDADRFGSLILQHKLLLSVGHDEYWSGNERANVEAAGEAGVHLGFFTGNGIFWKTRWENSSIDGTPYRTMVCYKETHADTAIDPLDPPISTATWRDPRFGPLPAGNGADGGHPENALQGTIFWVNGPSSNNLEIKVPPSDGRMRFWRNTSVAGLAASGRTYSTSINALGYEWDIDADNGFRPAGLFDLSTATYSTSDYLLDYGSNYGNGTATHHLTMYRYPCKSCIKPIVFGAGTSQWSWGLDGNHDGSSTTPDLNLQQATVNLLADMGVQPATLRTAGLKAATQTTDTSPPNSTINTPAGGSSVTLGSTVNITGTAQDTEGVVGGVEVSIDGGSTWHPATGRETWSYSWTPSASGTVVINSRAVDDSGNLGPSAGVTVTVGGGGTIGTTIFTTQIPNQFEADSSYELGTKFYADVSGNITAVRLYTNALEGGDHTVRIWQPGASIPLIAGPYTWNIPSGTQGWKTFTLPAPLSIIANTDYIVAISNSSDHYYAEQLHGLDSPIVSGHLHTYVGSGMYTTTMEAMPTNVWENTNYFRDVVFVPQ